MTSSKSNGANYGAVIKAGLVGTRPGTTPPKRRPYGYQDDDLDDTDTKRRSIKPKPIR